LPALSNRRFPPKILSRHSIQGENARRRRQQRLDAKPISISNCPAFKAFIVDSRTGEKCITSLKSDERGAKVGHGIVGSGMNERPRKATRLTVSLEEQDYRTLNEIALARDASISWVIRQAIRQFIDATPRPIDQLPPPPSGLPGGDR
jgi:hypothetical protein